MTTQLQRQRTRPTWRAGLRRGKIRDSMTQYLAERPEFAERIRELSRYMDAMGWEPVSMDGVRQPFDYEPMFRRVHER